MRKWNFCAGPAVISEEVLAEVKEELLEWGDSGMSIMEMSHRSKIYDGVATEAKQDFKDILNIPESHDVLFLQGGATHQFSMVPLNFGSKEASADYIVSGSWSKKAVSEASKVTGINTIASSEDSGFTSASSPDSWAITKDAAYVHYCPNETIQGVAIHAPPTLNKPLIADMSSVILSEPIDVSKFSLIYAGAQKNIGPAGLTMVVIEKELMSMENESLPNILRYSKHSESDSMLNTPPTFSWYMAGKVFKWIKKSGGLDFFHEQNHRKASSLYAYIDNSSFYTNPVSVENRSIMETSFPFLPFSFSTFFKFHGSIVGFKIQHFSAIFACLWQ